MDEYFLTRFACAEGQNGGQWRGATWTAIGRPMGWRGGSNQFYTPSCVVRCLVAELHAQFAESAKLELAINANLENLMLKLKS